METVFGPLQIDHYNSKRAADIQFTIQDRPLSDVFGEVMSRIKSSVALPIGYGIVPFGAVNNLRALVQAIGFVFPLAVVVVYLLLVMQFQSFIRPLAIILSVPLSIIGANVLVNVSGVPSIRSPCWVHHDGGVGSKKCHYIDHIYGPTDGARR